MDNVKTLAQRINIPNKELLQLMEEAGLSQTKTNDEVSPEDQKAVIAYLKQKRDKEQIAKPKILSLKRPAGAAAPGKISVLHKRKKTTETMRSVEEKNALDEREKELANIAEQKKMKAEEERQEQDETRVTQEQAQKQQEDQDKAKEKEEPSAQAGATQTPAVAEKKSHTTPVAHQTIKNKPTSATVGRKPEEPPRTKSVTKKRRSTKTGGTTNPSSPTELVQLNEFSRGRKAPVKASKNPLKSNLLTQNFQKPVGSTTKDIVVGENIQISVLAHRLGIKAPLLMKELMKLGFMATINQSIDYETAALVAGELGHNLVQREAVDMEEQVMAFTTDSKYAGVSRPPVVTVMGHVDHGKTSLLDYIRRTKVVDGESGGITQHIGAYHVETDKGVLSFLDTPGHAAFTSMRARGAMLTDIVVLVVATDDKVMPQTIEAIQHARSAQVPVVVALNKIDRPEADPERLISELAAHEIVPEDWGGDNQFVKLSAATGEGVDALLDAIILQAELLELTAPDQGPARGTVVESRLDRHRGPLASILVRQGRLKKGDQILVGTCIGRVRSLTNEQGQQISDAGPSIPVELTGLSEVPEAGDDLTVVVDEKAARELAEAREQQREQEKSGTGTPAMMSIEDAFTNHARDQKTLNVVIKADTRGSMEAIRHSLSELENDEMKVNLVIAGTGGIAETDVSLAHATGARVIGFHVRADNKARQVAEKEGVKISYYSIIYELIDDIDNLLHGLLEPIFEENILGTAEVRDVFSASKFGKIAGSMVVDGSIFRNKPIRVIRNDTVIYEGELESLRRFKDDVAQVRAGTECGIGVKGYKDVRAGDKIEVFDKVEVERKRIKRGAFGSA